MPQTDFEKMVDAISHHVHAAWIDMKVAQGVTSRLSETGEELMVAYESLSEAAKDFDRMTVVTVLKAINAVDRANRG